MKNKTLNTTKNKSWLILLLVLAGGCNVGGTDIGHPTIPSGNSGSGGTNSPPTNPPSIPPPVPPAGPVTSPGTIAVNLGSLTNFSADRSAKALRAAAILGKVLASEAFRTKILNFSWNGSQQFTSTNLTNAEVYAALMAGRESYTVSENHAVDLNYNLYTPPAYNKWGTVGYTYEGSDQIYANIYYFDSFSEAEIAANIAHEWTHKLGFDHDYNSTTQRPYSVPYRVGTIVGELGAL